MPFLRSNLATAATSLKRSQLVTIHHVERGTADKLCAAEAMSDCRLHSSCEQAVLGGCCWCWGVQLKSSPVDRQDHGFVAHKLHDVLRQLLLPHLAGILQL